MTKRAAEARLPHNSSLSVTANTQKAGNTTRPLPVARYHAQARITNRLAFRELSFGLFGEVGGLLARLKKQQRDDLVLAETHPILEELGDTLWYLVNLAEAYGFEVEIVAAHAWNALRQYFKETPRVPPTSVTFAALEGICRQHHLQIHQQGDYGLRWLACNAGAIVADDKNGSQAQAAQQVQLGEVLAALVLVGVGLEINMQDVALANLDKISDRWAGIRPVYKTLLKHGEAHEQFPGRLDIKFTQRVLGRRIQVFQQLNGVNIGDPLTDNSHRADGYRFHDAFHIAYAVHLGWSPVLRALLKLKRKSVAEIDENEDGARAIIMEEGISTWIFNHSLRRSPKYFADVQPDRLDYSLLKQIRNLCTGFEVAQAPLWQWERAILDGFATFRSLLAHKGGTVMADLTKHTMRYQPPAPAAP